ncbi:hypothetical protein M408DRAFT_135024 [Serendipita vermifera MAFF 305830]|uniref:Aminoglycoside phosphotransferase domain-containing protein n=1 Tax=Serendipita vermifera MAFF 305830 TaxID=933852 RepID=A0A0C2XII3_SERVB|nr:hypothetical protein M408DRAFT_135024 [Serendipita vermifera MAFF 305830]
MKVDDYTSEERDTMLFLRQHTNIPIPQPRFLTSKEFVMDHVEGTVLGDCWGKLSWFTQFRVACTLRLYIRQLRGLTRDAPGPIAGPVRGPMFDLKELTNTFENWVMFRSWVEVAAARGWRQKTQTSKQRYGPFPLYISPEISFTPLVFTHGDLHPGNLILSSTGKLSVIDWGESGYYPPWFQWVSMNYHCTGARPQPKTWRRWIGFITGANFTTEARYWGCFIYGLF